MVTPGVALRRLQRDPELPGVSALIVDEFHERDLDTDLALAFALDARSALRDDLFVALTSATLEASRTVDFLRASTGEEPALVDIPGDIFPLELRYAPPPRGVEAVGAIGNERVGVRREYLAHGARPGGKEQDSLRGMDAQRCRLITHGHNADPAVFEANVEALAQLCEIFGVEQAVPRQALQVGQRVEIDCSLKVEDQFRQLWDLLVPSSGPAPCLQGEAVRIAGRISHEIYDNGGLNWGRGFTALAKRFGRIVTSQVALADDDVARLGQALGCLKTRAVTTNYAEAMQASDVLTQMAVRWVRLNPVLVAGSA